MLQHSTLTVIGQNWYLVAMSLAPWEVLRCCQSEFVSRINLNIVDRF